MLLGVFDQFLIKLDSASFNNATNRVYFDPRDLASIVKHLKRFPGDDQDHGPVSLDLNGHVDVKHQVINKWDRLPACHLHFDRLEAYPTSKRWH